MGRMLSKDPCSVTFMDNISGSRITLQYRMPLASERVSFLRDIEPKPGIGNATSPYDVRAFYGAVILVGFDKGAFDVPLGGGGKKPLSSDASSEHYDPAWRDKVLEFAPDILAMLAMFVFENSVVTVGADGKDPFLRT